MVLARIPLLIDTHFHARDNEEAHKGTIESESKAALLGGFGTIMCMPNTRPPLFKYRELWDYRYLAAATSFCDTGFYFGSVGDNLGEFRKVQGAVSGLKVYLNPTTGGYNVTDLGIVEGIFTFWNFPTPILVHAEGQTLAQVIDLAGRLGRKLHVCHTSLRSEVELIRTAKREGLLITAEVCPHHLTFTKADEKRLGPYGLMKPPLGTILDREALWDGLMDGTIDTIGTDHAPHTVEEKAKGSFGVVGDGALSVVLTEMAKRNIPWTQIINWMISNPAAIFGIRQPVDSELEIDLDEEFEFSAANVASLAGRSPYEGMTLRGVLKTITFRGVEVCTQKEGLKEKPRVRLI